MKLPNIVFFGNEKLATGLAEAKPVIRQALAAAGFEIEQVVTGPLSDLRHHQARLAVLAAYGRLIPKRILDEFPLGIINVHPSLLPTYRGPTPIEQAILDGATRTGVSIMLLSTGMDEGPIYMQRTVHLTGQETKTELTAQLQQLGATLLTEALPRVVAGTLKPRQQPHPDRATYSKKLTKADGQIDWNKPAVQLEREVRAFYGWPGSYTDLGGKPVIITKARVEVGKGQPGEWYKTDSKELAVYTGQDSLIIESIKPSGKTEMSGRDFLNGLRQPA